MADKGSTEQGPSTSTWRQLVSSPYAFILVALVGFLAAEIFSSLISFADISDIEDRIKKIDERQNKCQAIMNYCQNMVSEINKDRIQMKLQVAEFEKAVSALEKTITQAIHEARIKDMIDSARAKKPAAP